MGWFLFWFSNNFFVQHESFLGTNISNLFGFLICITIVFVFIRVDLVSILLRSNIERQTKHPEAITLLKTDNELKSQVQEIMETKQSFQQIESLQTDQPSNNTLNCESDQSGAPIDRPKRREKQKTPAKHQCEYFENLQKREKSDPVPDECLTCSKLLDCMMKTKSTN